MYVGASVWQGNVGVHLRERRWTGDQTGHPGYLGYTKKGVLLTLAEWRALGAAEAAVSEALNSRTPLTINIGDRGRRVVVYEFRRSWYVDIRNFYRRPGAVEESATRLGATLNREAWERLLFLREFVDDDVDTLTEGVNSRAAAAQREDDDLARRREELRRRRERGPRHESDED
jgi:hypothetical protein